MKIKNNKKTLKIILLCLLGVALIGGGYATYAYSYHTWPFQNPEESATDQKNMPKANNSIKEKSADQAKEESKGIGSDAPEAPTPSPSGGKSTVTMDITAASVNSGTLMIRTLIEYVTSDGKCTLNMSGPSGAAYTTTADVQASASSTSCKGFNIPTSSLKSGVWTIKILFENNDVTGTVVKDITI